jgi:EAL domain-containing protein (putative c-di-GMP-specific phosphodiesterase class I)
MNARSSSIRSLPARRFDLSCIHVHYQPEVCLHTKRVVAVEALIRYDDPLYGRIETGEVLRLAAEHDATGDVTTQVLVEALTQTSRWRRSSAGRSLRLGINLSVAQIRDPSLAARIAEALEECAAAPDVLEVEIAERDLRVLWTQDGATAAVTDLGVRLAVDDFSGDGVTPAIWQQRGAHLLKIDKAVIDAIDEAADLAATEAMIETAHNAGLGVIAKGVETTDQLAFLESSGCDRIQGYLMARPLDADAFGRFLQRHAGDLA